MTITFDDLEKLPDDVEYQLPDGTKVKLGDIRDAAKSHVNKRIADLTPREQKLAADRKALEERQAMVQDQEKKIMEMLANQPAPPRPTVNPQEPIPLGYSPDQWAAIKADPFSRPIVEALALMANRLEETEKRLSEANTSWQQREEARKQQEEANWIKYQFQQLASADPRYKDPAEQQALLDYAKEVVTRRDLSVLDRARNFDARLKQAQEEAYQKGLKEGGVNAPVPPIPYNTKVAPVPPAPEKLPATFNEFVDSSVQDPDLIRSIREASVTPPAAP